ncbi:two-component system, sporulation sensor kinase A [Lentibacillus halodurans]|uniref:histidine kinase n=1 Tax=Lentibacillus halodurans TaxID=237679 RepID=A0A1I0VHQ7_9BACI|nr:ATP-binding protein [Lentibacillus halodurans]SFA75573.1 two-component system, sporulation sensor kinase A [Lentibacillus halodurans]
MIDKSRKESAEMNENEQHNAATSNDYEFDNLASLPSPILRWIDRNMNGFITLWDQNGAIIYISNTAEQLLGYPAAAFIGTKWFEWISPEDISYIQKNLDITQNRKQVLNINIQDVYGKSIWTENQITAIQDANGNHYYISATKDITDKKEAEEMMIRSEKMSVAGQLAAGIAHEIRNPLTSIKGFLQLLQAGVNREDEYYKIMVDEIEKMETITSELLFVSKPMTDHKELENLPELIDDVVTLLNPQAGLKNIEILWKQESNQNVKCDRSQIKQVFINILKNAIEAMEKPGYIKVNDYIHHNEILIDIIDEGPGIPEEVIHKLGEPFFTTKQNGTGPGLMITRQILERHGGRLEILQNEDTGSTFRVILPKP